MMIHQDAFAWDDLEWGHFREDFFLPVEIPTIPHTPWVLCNIPIPPGIYNKVCTLLKRKIDAGIFEPSNLSYGSRWFCVIKKDGKSLWIVQSLEPLNKVTIQHSGVPPFTDQLAEHFAGCACGSMMDLYVNELWHHHCMITWPSRPLMEWCDLLHCVWDGLIQYQFFMKTLQRSYSPKYHMSCNPTSTMFQSEDLHHDTSRRMARLRLLPKTQASSNSFGCYEVRWYNVAEQNCKVACNYSKRSDC